MKFEMYPQQSGLRLPQWRWRLVVAANGKIIASGEGYNNKADCQHAVNLVMGTGPQTPFFETRF